MKIRHRGFETKSVADEVEHKALTFDVKALSADGEFEGYAAYFGNVDTYGDVVAPGAFARTLKAKGASGIKLLVDHDSTKRVGILLEAGEDARGLKVKGKIVAEKQIGAETLIDLRTGMLDSMSIGYRTVSDRVDRKTGVRTIEEVDLFEVSFVPFPANPKARVTAVKSDVVDLRDRLAAGDRLTEREMERLFKSCLDLSNAEAERAVRVNVKAGRGDPGIKQPIADFARRLMSDA